MKYKARGEILYTRLRGILCKTENNKSIGRKRGNRGDSGGKHEYIKSSDKTKTGEQIT